MPTTESITAALTDYVLAAAPGDLPAAVRREGLRSFLNVLGCTIGGARHATVDIAWSALQPFAGEPHATLIGRRRKTDALTACLINTLSSSVYTFDDTHAEAIVHPSGPVMGAVLAVAEGQPVTGRELLTAFTLGVEIVCRLSKALSVPPAQSNIGWSQTGIACGIGAALAAAKLMRLDSEAARRAVGIAASQSAGIRAMHGTMCTPMLPAQAGQTGLRAAYLAKAGFTSSQSSIEARYGFAACFAASAHLPALTDRLGQHFEILANTYKPYPCGIVIHPLIDGALQLRSKHDLEPSAIDRVEIRAAPAALALCDRRHPADEFEGQVSLYHWVAAAFVRGRAGVNEGQDAAIRDPALLAFRERITATIDASMPVDGVDMAVTLKGGAAHAVRIRDCIGSKGRPMTDRQLEEKFRQLADGVLAPAQIARLIEDCWRLEALADAAVIAHAAA